MEPTTRTETLAARRMYLLLQQAFLKLLGEIPFEKLTLTELCDEAMVPRSTFYRYFEDKYDFVRFCLRGFLEKAGFDEYAICLDDMESFQRFMAVILFHLSADREQYRKILRLNRDGILLEQIRSYLKDLLSLGIKKAQENGRRLTICEPIFLTLLTDLYVSALTCYLELDQEYSPLQYASDLRFFIEKKFFTD